MMKYWVQREEFISTQGEKSHAILHKVVHHQRGD